MEIIEKLSEATERPSAEKVAEIWLGNYDRETILDRKEERLAEAESEEIKERLEEVFELIEGGQ